MMSDAPSAQKIRAGRAENLRGGGCNILLISSLNV